MHATTGIATTIAAAATTTSTAAVATTTANAAAAIQYHYSNNLSQIITTIRFSVILGRPIDFIEFSILIVHSIFTLILRFLVFLFPSHYSSLLRFPAPLTSFRLLLIIYRRKPTLPITVIFKYVTKINILNYIFLCL